MSVPRRHIVGIGGTVRSGSSSEQALRVALQDAAGRGATTAMFIANELSELPLYRPGIGNRNMVARSLLDNLRRADGIIISSPAYHGSVSGLVKNALDYTEDLRDDRRPYLAERPIGLVVSAYGWQAAVTTLSALRSIAHALRGWVTPYGVTINSAQAKFVESVCTDPKVMDQLSLVAEEVLLFADMAASHHLVTGSTLAGVSGS